VEQLWRISGRGSSRQQSAVVGDSAGGSARIAVEHGVSKNKPKIAMRQGHDKQDTPAPST